MGTAGTAGTSAATPGSTTSGGTTAGTGADATGAAGQRVASAGNSKTFDCDDGRSFVATYNDPAYNGATSIAMQAGGATPSANLQVSLGEDTATLTDGATTINCRARQ
jgi:hypothetical protein